MLTSLRSSSVRIEGALGRTHDQLILTQQQIGDHLDSGFMHMKGVQKELANQVISGVAKLLQVLPAPRFDDNTVFGCNLDISESDDKYKRSEIQDTIARCQCCCHAQTRYESPWILQVVMGKLYLVHCSSQKCNDGACRIYCSSKRITTSLAWIAPHWAPVQHMLALKIESARYSGPALSLAFPRIVSGDALIFHYATIGHVNGIKTLFAKGLACPDDVKYESGFTAFHYAVQSDNMDVCALLLQAHGNPALVTNACRTAADLAVTKILTSTASRAVIEQLWSLFDISTLVARREFPLLHKVILGLESGNVSMLLGNTTLIIDEQDKTGRTALSWAAQLGDSEAILLLLQHGANPDSVDHYGITSLHYAAQASDITGLRYILKHSARAINWKDFDRGWTPFHYAAMFQSDPAFLNVLLDYGSEIDGKASNGKTPLILTVLKRQDRCTRQLLERGADPDLPESVGWTPLNVSIMSNAVESLRALLDHNVDLTQRMWRSETVLHILAQYASIDIIECIIQRDLGNIDVHALNYDGESAQDVLRRRENTDPRLLQAFRSLHQKIIADARAKPKVLSQEFVNIEEYPRQGTGLWEPLLADDDARSSLCEFVDAQSTVTV
jgi:ankyrin repeat protein